MANNLLTISTLKGGLNDLDPPLSLADDQCTVAENVEFFFSTMGERRHGCQVISDLPAAITGDANIQAVTWFGAHNPSNTLGDEELWALAQHLTNSNYTLQRRSQSAWSTITPDDDIIVTSGYGHRLSGVSLHGKFFIAYKSLVDRLHVWDGTTLRVAGLSQPAAPTASDTAGAGTFAGTRYYRIRYVVMSGSAVLLRSEASDPLTFNPVGTKDGATINKPASIGEGETHWELEASTDNASFYRIARTAVGTGSVTDNVAFGTGYAISGVLSEDLTSYTLIPSGKFLSVDSDRLIIAGSWETPEFASRIWWTPVFGNTGSGNDERLDMTVNPFIDLDGFEGGEITGLSRAVNGYLYAFKWGHIYKVVRTGQRSDAYTAIPLTKARGAIPGSLIEAVDQSGNPSEYFLDPKIGPMRIGNYGLEWVGSDVFSTWSRINLSAVVPAHGVFYEAKNQIHWWVALDDSDYPNAKIVLQCNEMRSDSDSAHRGWSTVPVGDRIAAAHCSIMFSNNVDTTDPRNQMFRPFIGKEEWDVNGSTVKDLIQLCDTGATDALTDGDNDAYYYAKLSTKPFTPASIMNKFKITSGVLAAVADRSATNDIYIRATRNLGVEDSKDISVSLLPEGSEDVVFVPIDNLNFTGMRAIQFTFGDLNENILPSTSWQLHQFTAKLSLEQTGA